MNRAATSELSPAFGLLLTPQHFKFEFQRVSIVHTLIVPPLHAPSNAEVTAVVHFTEDRLQLIQLTCSRWGGPVLGIFFLYPEELPLLALLVSVAQRNSRKS